MRSTRQRKVQELLVQEISDILRRDLRDPRVGFVTITEAEVTPDLRHAHIYFSVLGTLEEKEATTSALNRAAGFVRSEFARRAQMRYVPDIQFHFDKSVEHGSQMSALLEKVRQDDNRPTGAGSPNTGPTGVGSQGADPASGGDDPSSE